MKLRPCGDLCFIRPDQQPTESETGLSLVYDRQASSMRGVVVALGDGPVTRTGVPLPHHVEVGQSVVFPPDKGEELFFEHEPLICLREDDILAVIL